MDEEKKTRYENSSLDVLDRNFQFSDEVLQALDWWRKKNPDKTSLSDASDIRSLYFEFYDDIEIDKFLKLVEAKTPDLASSSRETPSEKTRAVLSDNKIVPLLGPLSIAVIVIMVFGFFSLNGIVRPPSDGAEELRENPGDDNGVKKKRYLYNNSGVDIKPLFAVDTQGRKRDLGYLNANSDGFYHITDSERFEGCGPDGTRFVVLNSPEGEMFVNVNNASGQCINVPLSANYDLPQ